jgi:hypothetical protein
MPQKLPNSEKYSYSMLPFAVLRRAKKRICTLHRDKLRLGMHSASLGGTERRKSASLICPNCVSGMQIETPGGCFSKEIASLHGVKLRFGMQMRAQVGHSPGRIASRNNENLRLGMHFNFRFESAPLLVSRSLHQTRLTHNQ